MQKIRYFEVMFANGYSICIKGVREPSVEEAKEFLKEDMKCLGVSEIDYIEEWKFSDAITAFDFSDVEKWPLFGVNDS